MFLHGNILFAPPERTLKKRERVMNQLQFWVNIYKPGIYMAYIVSNKELGVLLLLFIFKSLLG